MNVIKVAALVVAFAGSQSVSADEKSRVKGVQNPDIPAKIMYVRNKPMRPYVVLDQGSLTGFVIGRDVCFYSLERVKINCASIVRTKSSASAVVVEVEKIGVLSKNFLAWPADLGALPPAPVVVDLAAEAAAAAAAAAKAEEDAAALALAQEDPPEVILPPILSTRIQVHLMPSLALPIWMSDLRFNAAARISGSGDIWESGDTIKGSSFGFGARYYIPQNGRGDSAVDFSYHFTPLRPVKDDFDVTDAATSIQSGVLSHHFRLRWFRGATWKHDDTSDVLLYTGLGYAFVRAKFNASKVGNETTEMVSGVITAHGLEVPLIVEYQKFLGRFMLSAGADMGVPVGVFGVKNKSKLTYDEDVGTADKSVQGAVDAVNVRRGWFSFCLQLGVGAKF
jgi:hypothetical protein